MHGRTLIRRPRRAHRLAALAAFALALVAGSSFAVAAIVGAPNHGHLVAVGPVEQPDGFPSWYKDDKNVRVEPCLDNLNALCNILPDTMPNPNAPVSFPDNFPNEFFYAVADSLMSSAGGGKLTTRLALEGAFFPGPGANPGDQVVFGRIRFFYSGLKAGQTYKITHPYGVDTFVAEQAPGAPDGVGRIRYTQDIGVSPGQFGGALNSRIGPFLRWDPATGPAAPAGYLGDPTVTHAITGSPVDANYVRIEGPGIAATPADQCSPTPAGLNPEDCIESKQFTVSGKLASNGGIGIDGATYSRTTTAGGTLDVFANSDNAPQSIEIRGAGFDPSRARGENGYYDAHIDFAGAPPAQVSAVNVGDTPHSSDSRPVTDLVKARAVFDVDTEKLTIDASSSDLAVPPTLHANGFGDLGANGVLVVDRLAGTPRTVTITSTAGGTSTAIVALSGTGFPPIPIQAFAGPDQDVPVGDRVVLDGTGSTGPIKSYAWTQTAGPAVTLSGADTASPSFTAPEVAPDPDALLEFELTATGSNSTSTSKVKVHVFQSAPAPVADAGADQTVAMDSVVTLDGSASLNASSYSWTQVGGAAVTLTGPTTARPTFRFPKVNQTLTFRLTATGAGGTKTDEVQISTTPDRLATTLVQYTASKREWRITGTSSIAGPGVTITIHNGSTLAGPVVGTQPVDTLGAWAFRPTTSSVAPDATRRVSIESSAGGQLLGVAVTVK